MILSLWKNYLFLNYYYLFGTVLFKGFQSRLIKAFRKAFLKHIKVFKHWRIIFSLFSYSIVALNFH